MTKAKLSQTAGYFDKPTRIVNFTKISLVFLLTKLHSVGVLLPFSPFLCGSKGPFLHNQLAAKNNPLIIFVYTFL